jgi:hypothetical protein
MSYSFRSVIVQRAGASPGWGERPSTRRGDYDSAFFQGGRVCVAQTSVCALRHVPEPASFGDGLFQFSTDFHTRIKPLTSSPTPSIPATSAPAIQTNPPRSNNHEVHRKRLLTISNYHATIRCESKPLSLSEALVVSPPPLRPDLTPPPSELFSAWPPPGGSSRTQ